MSKKNKVDTYKELFENIKNIQHDPSQDKLFQFMDLQTQLQFEIVQALQIIAKQNQNNNKSINYINNSISEIMGEPVELLLGDKDDTDNGKNK